MKKLIGLTMACAMVTQSAFAAGVVEDVATQLKRLKGTKSSFCFAVEKGAVTGFNENTPVRAASVTKTITTFWALKALGPNFQYTTRVYVQPSNKEVHITGGRDPFFDRDRLFVILADLNRKGLKQINRLTFDDGFWFWPEAGEWRYLSTKVMKGQRFSAREAFFVSEDHTRATIAGNPSQIKSSLAALMNTAAWSPLQKQRFARARTTYPALALPAAVAMKTDVVDHVPSNPLAGKPGVFEFEVKSAPLKMYLKQMNIHSINPYAEELFFSLGGKKKFAAHMARLGYGQQLAGVNSGSGVNLSNTGNRFDSTMTCSSVVRIIRTMDEDLEAKGLDLTDVMMAPAVDGGTAGWINKSSAFVVKTGTLKRPVPSKNLAGVENTSQGEVYFGIFLDGRNAGSYGVGKGLNAMRTHFKEVAVKSQPVAFAPMGSWSHLQYKSESKAQPEPSALQSLASITPPLI